MTSENKTARLKELLPKLQEEWEELHEIVDRLQGLIGQARHGIVTANLEGEIVSWNPAATEIFGWDETEILHRQLVTLMPDRYRSLHLDGLRCYKETGISNIMGQRLRLSGLHRDGHEIPLIITIFGYQTGAGRFVSAMIVRDKEPMTIP